MRQHSMQISRQATVNSFVACEEANNEDVPYMMFKITEAYKEHTNLLPFPNKNIIKQTAEVGCPLPPILAVAAFKFSLLE